MVYKKLFILLLSFGSFFGFSASQENLLHEADTLFEAGKFTQAYDIYDSLFQESYFTPSMLLKMARISEGSENYVDAIYFLNLYYDHTTDREVLQKISSLSDTHNFLGYSSYSDGNLFYLFVINHRGWLQFFLIIFILGIGVFFFIKKAQTKLWLSAIQVICLVVVVILSTYRDNSKGIIFADNTLLMSDPSAGAEVVRMVNKGHRVEILDSKQPVWTKIVWQGQVAFIKNTRIRFI